MMAENISTASNKSQVICGEMVKTNKSDTSSCLATDLITSDSLINKSYLNLNDPDLDVHALFLKYFEDGSESEHIKSLPGVSYMIFFAKTKNLHFFTFDCVICNPSAGNILSGKGLVKHLRNKSHLLNILKLHDYTLYEKYKDSSTEASADLFSKISICESNSEKEIHMVTAKTYREERKKITIIVTELYEVCDMNYEMQNPHAGKSDSDDDEADKNDIEVIELKETISEDVKAGSDDLDLSNGLPNKNILPQHLEVTKSKLPRISALKLFERIVIVTTEQYAPYFQRLKCQQVKLTYAWSCKIEDIASAIKNRQKFKPKRTLWLTHMEMFQAARFECCKMCSSCAKPFEVFIPPSEDSATLSDHMTGIRTSFDALAKSLSSILDSDSSFAVLPPFPPKFLILEESRHEQYHKMDMERKRFSFITKESMNGFQSFFIGLNKQLISLSFAEFTKANISFQSMADYSEIVNSWSSYVDVATSENNLDSVSNVKYFRWLEYSSKLLFENLEFEIPVLASGVLKSMNADDNYDHIVFICFSEEHALIIPEEKGNAKNISVLVLDSDKLWDESNKFNEIASRSFNKILFIIVGSLKLLGKTFQESYCLKEKCSNPLSYLQLEPFDVKEIVQSATQKLILFIKYLKCSLGMESTVILAPMIGLNCTQKPIINNVSSHENVHRCCLDASNLYLLEGDGHRWSKTCLEFNSMWCQVMHNDVYCHIKLHFKNLIKEFKKASKEINKFTFLCTPNSDYYQGYKLLLRDIVSLFCSKNISFQNVYISSPIAGYASNVPKSMNSDDNYDHIVFICFSEEHALIIPEEKGNAKNISVLVLNNDKLWNESNMFDEIRSRDFKNILFIIVGSLKLLGKTFQESYCLKEKCPSPLSYLQLEFFDTREIVKMKQKLSLFIKYLKCSLGVKSTVILAPLIGLNCTQKPIIDNESSHENVHRCLDTSNLYLLKGSKHRWTKICLEFNKMWCDVMHSDYDVYFYTKKHSFKNLINEFKNASQQINIFRFPCILNLHYYRRYKVILGDLVRLFCQNMSIQTVNFLSPIAGNVPQNMYDLISKISKTQLAALYRTQRSDPENTSESASRGFVPSEHWSPVYSKSSHNHKEFLLQENSISDSYFHSTLWNDCLTFGSESSFHYVVDAIRSLKACQRPFGKILLISSSVDSLNQVQNRLLHLDSDNIRGINLTVLSEASITADMFDCFLTTIYTVTNYHRDILFRKDIRAVIVDDVTKVMETVEDRIAIISAFQWMNLKENTGISKVFVAAFYQPKLHEYLTSIFGIPLIEVKTAECDTISSSENWAVQGFKEEKVAGYPMSSGQAVEHPAVSREDRSDNYSTDCGLLTSGYATKGNSEGLSASVGCSNLQSSFVSSNSNKIVHRSRSRDWQLSSASVGSSSHRRRSCSKTKRKTSHSTRRKETRRRSRHRSHSRSRKHLSSSSRHKRHRSRSESIDKMSTMKKRRTKSPKFRSRSRASSRSKVYHSKSSAQTSGRSYRSNNIETICSNTNFTTDRPDSTLANFSVKGALELVENMSDKMGVLGPVLKSLITNVKLNLDTNQTKALNIIKEENNIIFFKMTVDKLKIILLSASLSEISLISKTIEWTTRLISYAENAPQQEVNINLKAIAVASMSKPPEFTISLIKSALAYENNETPTKEEVNEIFIKVSSIQCEMITNN